MLIFLLFIFISTVASNVISDECIRGYRKNLTFEQITAENNLKDDLDKQLSDRNNMENKRICSDITFDIDDLSRHPYLRYLDIYYQSRGYKTYTGRKVKVIENWLPVLQGPIFCVSWD